MATLRTCVLILIMCSIIPNVSSAEDPLQEVMKGDLQVRQVTLINQIYYEEYDCEPSTADCIIVEGENASFMHPRDWIPADGQIAIVVTVKDGSGQILTQYQASHVHFDDYSMEVKQW